MLKQSIMACALATAALTAPAAYAQADSGYGIHAVTLEVAINKS